MKSSLRLDIAADGFYRVLFQDVKMNDNKMKRCTFRLLILACIVSATVAISRPAQQYAIEPMAGITDAMNLAHKGVYKDLQSIPPGGSWEANCWVKPSEF